MPLSKIAIVIITNKDFISLKPVLSEWESVLDDSVPLYVCAPSLYQVEYESKNIKFIAYDDDSKYFSINIKKRFALTFISEDGALLVHDRFIPGCDFGVSLKQLINDDPDFCGLDCNNMNSTPSIRALYVSEPISKLGFDVFFGKPGRACVAAKNAKLPYNYGINGGAFYLNKRVKFVLNRALRWFELEDDIMSIDLLDYRGAWYKGDVLRTLVYKPLPKWTYKGLLKHLISVLLDRTLAVPLSLVLSVYYKKEIVRLSSNLILDDLFSFKGDYHYLVDLLHFRSGAEVHLNALEKYIPRLRISLDYPNITVDKVWFGWKIYVN